MVAVPLGPGYRRGIVPILVITEGHAMETETTGHRQFQFGLSTLVLSPLLLIGGFGLAYAIDRWAYTAAEAVGYLNVALWVTSQATPTGFGAAMGTAMVDLPGIVCLYLLVFALGLFSQHRWAPISAVALIIGFPIAHLADIGVAIYLEWSWISLVFAVFAAVPLILGRRLSRRTSDAHRPRLSSGVCTVVAILAAVVAIYGIYMERGTYVVPATEDAPGSITIQN